MPADVRACDDHGFFEGVTCPVCDASGRRVLDGRRRERLSKFLSGALRHFPEDAGLALDDSGWTDFEAVVAAATAKYDWATREAVDAVVATDPKGRFERTSDGTERIRASYGHSVDVDLDDADTPVPDTLYHGTAPRDLDAIRDGGLRPMSRQQVHLSGAVAEAKSVGRRRADDPVVLEVDAAAMQEAGHRITKRGRETYTTDRVPPEFVDERENK